MNDNQRLAILEIKELYAWIVSVAFFSEYL